MIHSDTTPRLAPRLGPRLAQLLLLTAAVLPSPGCGDAQASGGPRPNVLVITLDGLRADCLGAYGAEPSSTPSMDQLAERSVRYAYALTPAPWAAPAYGSLWTGHYPSELGFTNLKRPLHGQTETLAESMGAAGWSTAAITSHRFSDQSTGLDQGFSEWIEVEQEPSASYASGAAVTAAALEQLDAFGSVPFLMWVQYSDLRLPFELPLPVAAEYGGPIRAGMERAELLRLAPELDEQDAARLLELYELELKRLDGYVGLLLERIESLASKHGTVVVLTAPHGSELLERGGVGDAGTLHDEIVRVPLLISVPGASTGVIHDPVSLVDVAPTLRACIKLQKDSAATGLCVLPGFAAPERPIFSETSRALNLRAVVDGDWKLIMDQRHETQVLFDVFNDPDEEKNAADTHGQVRDRLERELYAFEARVSDD
ncbi:MAG: arylsulfatase A-like enzyme [Planctomycetota bacterium]